MVLLVQNALKRGEHQDMRQFFVSRRHVALQCVEKYRVYLKPTGEIAMGNKIVTEADRKRTPRPIPPKGVTLLPQGRGQGVSLERGVHTRSKKNPGKRAHSG